MEFFHKVPKIPFMAQRRMWYTVSTVMILASLLAIGVRGLNFGVDFTGGIVVEAGFPGVANLQKTRDALAAAGYGSAQVQNFGTSRDILVRLPPTERSPTEVADRVATVLKTVDAGVQIRRTEVVGAQVGKELFGKGMTAMAITLLLILIYIALRFRWKFGVGAILATMHDPIVAIGFFAATGLTFDLTVLAAVLALIGYSINDTVVVFDRVRERFLSMRKAKSAEVFDSAINETLSRTIITHGATTLVVVCLYLFGGESLAGFALALIVGIIVGTYSSIYIASGVALDLGVSHRDLLASERRAPVDDLP